MGLTTISYGGGVQSTAMLVLACKGELGYPVTDALFANVGDDSEHPGTLTFVRDTAIPWAAERGIRVHELNRVKRTGDNETLWGRLMKEGSGKFRFEMDVNTYPTKAARQSASRD